MLITEKWAYGHPGDDVAPGRRAINQALHSAQNGVCEYCGHTVDHLHADHITPKSKGGADYIENFIGACRRCNSARGNRSQDWMHETVKARRAAYEMMFAVGDVL